MELAIQVQVEKLPEGVFLATSDELPGLIAQGRTIKEAIEIAGDVAKKLIEMQSGSPDDLHLVPAQESFDYPLIVNA